jgi:hypothetical protein
LSKFHYWTTINQADDDEVSIDTTTPLVTLSPATRRTDDTLLRYLVWPKLVATVGTSSLPNLDWIAGATVDWLFYFDLASSGFQVNINDDNPLTIGFTRLNHSVWTTPTTNKYVVSWQGPEVGVNVETARKGSGGIDIPALSAQRWVSDNHGVFDNFASFSVLFSSRLIGRALWASDDPPP